MKKITLLLFVASLFFACKNTPSNESDAAEMNEETTADSAQTFPYQISLAQWSLHKRYQAEGSNPMAFPKDAKELGFEGIELVSQLYTKQIESLGFQAVLDSLKNEGERNKTTFVLIMVDGEGDLVDPDETTRNHAVENHKKWVDAAAYLGAHSIRVNTFGTNDPEEWKVYAKDGLTKLSNYAATKNINVIVENHGWVSSMPHVVMEVLNEINLANCGTLPDFGNWCISREKGERWGKCLEEYPDMYEGIALMLPKAKGVSAKSYNFDEEGYDTKIDYVKMLQIVRDSDFDGWIGIEYEGENTTEPEGIQLTKDLLLKAYQQTK